MLYPKRHKTFENNFVVVLDTLVAVQYSHDACQDNRSELGSISTSKLLRGRRLSVADACGWTVDPSYIDLIVALTVAARHRLPHDSALLLTYSSLRRVTHRHPCLLQKRSLFLHKVTASPFAVARRRVAPRKNGGQRCLLDRQGTVKIRPMTAWAVRIVGPRAHQQSQARMPGGRSDCSLACTTI